MLAEIFWLCKLYYQLQETLKWGLTYMTKISLHVTLGEVKLVLNAVSATWAILRRPILITFYDTHGDTEDTFSTQTTGIIT